MGKNTKALHEAQVAYDNELPADEENRCHHKWITIGYCGETQTTFSRCVYCRAEDES